MKVTSRKGERKVLLDAEERRSLSKTYDAVAELAELSGDQRAEDVARLLNVLLAVYSPPTKAKKEAAA